MSQHVVGVEAQRAASRARVRTRRGIPRHEAVTLWISRVVIWVVIVLTLAPMWFVVEAAFNPTNAYFSLGLFPSHPSFGNFAYLFHQTNFLIWVKNSALVGFTVSLGQVLVTALAAFAFSRLRFWGRKYGLMVLIILQMFPNFLALAAIYTALAELNLLNELWVYMLILMGGSAFNIWLLKRFFDSVPKELDDAAFVDGATVWQRFSRIILPLARPMLIVIFIFTLMGSFSEYILAGTILETPNNYTLGLGMYGLISNQFAKNWGYFAAAALLSAVPLAVTFGLLQKYIASGLMGGVKG